MLKRIRLNSKATSVNNTGFGTNNTFSGGRFVNRDGTPNIIKSGIPLLDKYSLYHSLIAYPTWKFLSVIILFFIGINFIFACIYYIIGIDHLSGMMASSSMNNFGEAFFFSAQTFTTVGYGRINPVGFVASAVAALEALIGLLCFALATGLLYGRFARPQAFLKFSDHALIAPYKEGTALMLRMAPYKNNNLTEAEVKLTLALVHEENNKPINKFYQLNLEFSKINALTLSWTIVHPIDEDSPLYNINAADLKNLRFELLVFVKAFDESFSNTVMARTSYTTEELVVGAKFTPMYHPSADGRRTVLDLDKINEIENMPLSV